MLTPHPYSKWIVANLGLARLSLVWVVKKAPLNASARP
jgi:hypothetical protein